MRSVREHRDPVRVSASTNAGARPTDRAAAPRTTARSRCVEQGGRLGQVEVDQRDGQPVGGRPRCPVGRSVAEWLTPGLRPVRGALPLVGQSVPPLHAWAGGPTTAGPPVQVQRISSGRATSTSSPAVSGGSGCAARPPWTIRQTSRLSSSTPSGRGAPVNPGRAGEPGTPARSDWNGRSGAAPCPDPHDPLVTPSRQRSPSPTTQQPSLPASTGSRTAPMVSDDDRTRPPPFPG